MKMDEGCEFIACYVDNINEYIFWYVDLLPTKTN